MRESTIRADTTWEYRDRPVIETENGKAFALLQWFALRRTKDVYAFRRTFLPNQAV